MTLQNVNPSILQTISAVLLLDNEGKRLLTRYFVLFTNQDQLSLENKIWSITHRKPLSQVAIIDNHLVIFKTNLDIQLYILAPLDTNELLVGSFLESLFEALEVLLKPQVDKRAIIDEYDKVALLFDEAIDNGIILEVESSALVAKISHKELNSPEPSLAGAFQFAKEAFAKRILK